MAVLKWQDPKDPDDVLDYTIRWHKILASGEGISSVTWTVPTGLTLDSQANTTNTTTAWLSGGTDGTDYAIKAVITTDNATPREIAVTITLEVRTRYS